MALYQTTQDCTQTGKPMKQLQFFNQKPILEVLKPIKQPTNESVCGEFLEELLKEPVYLEDCLGDLQDPTSELVEKWWNYLSKPIRFQEKIQPSTPQKSTKNEKS